VRRARTAKIQELSRRSGANYDASSEHQETRDLELKERAATTASIFNYDAETEALAAAQTTSP
jgi:salicylate hydroxylase